MTSAFARTLPAFSRPHPYCRICGDMIDGLGAEMGKTRCFWCDTPAQVGTRPKGGDGEAGSMRSTSDAVAEGDAPMNHSQSEKDS